MFSFSRAQSTPGGEKEAQERLLLPLGSDQQINWGNMQRVSEMAHCLPCWPRCVCKVMTQEIRARRGNYRDNGELFDARRCAFHGCRVGVAGFQKKNL